MVSEQETTKFSEQSVAPVSAELVATAPITLIRRRLVRPFGDGFKEYEEIDRSNLTRADLEAILEAVSNNRTCREFQGADEVMIKRELPEWPEFDTNAFPTDCPDRADYSVRSRPYHRILSFQEGHNSEAWASSKAIATSISNFMERPDGHVLSVTWSRRNDQPLEPAKSSTSGKTSQPAVRVPPPPTSKPLSTKASSSRGAEGYHGKKRDLNSES